MVWTTDAHKARERCCSARRWIADIYNHMDAMSAALLLQNATKTLYCGPLWRSIGNCGGTGAASNVGVLQLSLWATLWRGIAAQSNGAFFVAILLREVAA